MNGGAPDVPIGAADGSQGGHVLGARSGHSAGSALASVLFSILGLLLGYYSDVSCTIRRVIAVQFQGLTRITLVAHADAVLGLDQETIAHERHQIDLTGGIAWRRGSPSGRWFLASHLTVRRARPEMPTGRRRAVLIW